MAIHFNHTILSARDSEASATFLAEILGLPAPTRWGPFHLVTTENGALQTTDNRLEMPRIRIHGVTGVSGLASLLRGT